jgi:hypothetical protein
MFALLWVVLNGDYTGFRVEYGQDYTDERIGMLAGVARWSFGERLSGMNPS